MEKKGQISDKKEKKIVNISNQVTKKGTIRYLSSTRDWVNSHIRQMVTTTVSASHVAAVGERTKHYTSVFLGSDSYVAAGMLPGSR